MLGISISSCTKAEIESNANEAGNVVGKTIKGVSSGFIDGLKGKDEQLVDLIFWFFYANAYFLNI